MKLTSMRSSGASCQAMAASGMPARSIARPLPGITGTMRHRHVARVGMYLQSRSIYSLPHVIMNCARIFNF